MSSDRVKDISAARLFIPNLLGTIVITPRLQLQKIIAESLRIDRAIHFATKIFEQTVVVNN
ncbi:MAG: hypothetical protein ACYCQJ_07830 [Nitrososphaerales archaeon]